MGNSLNVPYTPAQVAKAAVNIAKDDAYLAALVSRNFEDDLLGGGGKGRTVNLKVPAVLVARERGIDEVDAAIVMDKIVESTVGVTLGSHLYSAIPLSEGDISLNLESFTAQVLGPQADAVAAKIEDTVAKAIAAIPLDTVTDWLASDPVKTFTQIRKVLRLRGVPSENLNAVVGVNVYAALLDAKAITDASESASTAALREGSVGRIRGFQIVESTRVGADEIVVFHRDAFALAVRAPKVPEGVTFGQSVSAQGFSLRYIRDYDVTKMVDRSVVSTFAGITSVPLYKVTRDHATFAATIVQVPGGAAFRMSIGDAEA